MAAYPSQPDRPPSPTFDQLQALLDRSLAQHSAIVDSWMSAAPSSSSQRGKKQGEDAEEVRRWRMRPARLGLGAPMPTQERQHQSTSLSQLNKHLSVGKKRKRSHSPDASGRVTGQKGGASRTKWSDSEEEEESRSRMVERGRKSNVGAGKKGRGVFDLPAGQGKGKKVLPPPVGKPVAPAELSFGPRDAVQIDPSAVTNTAALGDGKKRKKKKKKRKNGEVAPGPTAEDVNSPAGGEGAEEGRKKRARDVDG